MNKKVVFFSSLFFLSLVTSAKDILYPVSDIPPALLENAHTVIRDFKLDVEIKSENSAKVSVTEVRTVLNKNGERNVFFMALYNKMNRISNIKGKIYNSEGKQIKSLNIDDVIDHSYINGFSLYEDNRVKFYDPKYLTYPLTVAYSYDIDMKQTLFFPEWSHDREYTSYENSSFVVMAPAGYSFRYKEFNLIKKAVKSQLENKDQYTWTLTNLKARKDELMASVSSPDYPLVRLAPTNFVVEDTKGSAETWNNLGSWVTGLIDNKDVLPESTQAKIKELTDSCKTDLDKVKAVYEFMQQKTRYVSIQVGIGGWQPFDAITVDKTSYGDCKALSNYTKALLSSAGIKSFYTLVNAGTSADLIDTTFPSSYFNHAIVCVPLTNDTVWLECTNQRLPCGYNSDFTDDREVLLIDGANSKLVHTRIYPSTENCINRNTHVSLVDIESGRASSTAHYIGLSYDQMIPVLYADDANKLKIITQSIELPSFSLIQFSITENRSKTPSIDQRLELTFNNYIRKMGSIALLPLNFMNKLTSIPDKVRNRKTEMCIRRAYMENDTVVFELPKEFQVTDIPSKSEIEGKFGKYRASTLQVGSTITYYRHFELFKGTFPAEAYSEYRDFLEQIATADEAVVCLKY